MAFSFFRSLVSRRSLLFQSLVTRYPSTGTVVLLELSCYWGYHAN